MSRVSWVACAFTVIDQVPRLQSIFTVAETHAVVDVLLTKLA